MPSSPRFSRSAPANPSASSVRRCWRRAARRFATSTSGSAGPQPADQRLALHSSFYFLRFDLPYVQPMSALGPDVGLAHWMRGGVGDTPVEMVDGEESFKHNLPSAGTDRAGVRGL